MNKRTNKYHLKLTMLKKASGSENLPEPLELFFQNHDDLFALMERIKEKNVFAQPSDSQEFIIGLKMFSEVMIKNRSYPLFEELLPAFRIFMEKLKR